MSDHADTESVHFVCPQCAAPLSAPVSQAGSALLCSACQAHVRVPAPPAGEAPAPAVVSQVAAVAPADALETPPAPLAESPAPALVAAEPSAGAASPAPTEIAAQGMDVASDPAASSAPPPPAPLEGATASLPSAAPGAPESPVAPQPPPAPDGALSPLQYSRISEEIRPPRSPARRIVAVLAVLIFAAIASLVGISVANGLERNRIEQQVKGLVENAETAFLAGDLGTAAEFSRQSRDVLAHSPQPLDPESVQHWRARTAHFLAMKAEMDQLRAIFGDAGKDLPAARNRLETKKTLYGPVTADNQPVVARLEALLLDLAKLELKQKQDRLRDELRRAETLYQSGKVEDAAACAAELAKLLPQKPALQDPDLDKRLHVLSRRGEQLRAAKDVRLAARSGTYAEAKRKLQVQLDALDEKNPDLQPLCQRLTQLKNELVQEEQRGRKLTAEETTKLKAFVAALAMRDKQIVPGQPEGDGFKLTYTGKPLRLGLHRGSLGESVYLEAGAYRLLVDWRDLERRTARVLTHALALGEALAEAGVPSGEAWNATDEAPLPTARRTGDDGKEYIFLGGQLYVGKPLEKTESEKEVEADFAKKAEALAVAVENDAPSREDVRRVVAVAVRASYKEAEWWDHLPGEFVRKVVNEGYLEKSLPGAADRLRKELGAFREAYAKISNPGVRFRGASVSGDEAVEMRTFEEHAVWRLHSKAAATTTFAIKNPDDERGCLFILYDFPGKLEDFPRELQPATVRMTHQAVGVTATYDLAAGKMTCDQALWDRAVTLESPLIPAPVRKLKGLGPPGWCLPPHVLLVDMLGNTRSIVTPFGRLDVQDFSRLADPAGREQAMDAFLGRLAQVLPTANYLHLYFRYFLEYILDSPITSLPDLLGSRAHCGDIHQTTRESLQRFMGGRYVGDCDDLAEFFMTVTRRQNKLSYVMALPQHAACGWVEKPPQANEYTFYVLDTGPPRMFTDADLEKAIEKACRAYDEDKTMRFDPKSLGFLFRFAGEPTRSPYWLSSRMYVDPVYGDVMERVQGYWHFHFYALGIKTMTEMIEKGDRVPENCIELAGLYGQVRETADSIRWTNEAIKQFSPEERISRLNEEYRIAMMWREEHDNQKCYDALKSMSAELKRLQADPQTMNFVSLRLQLMNLLVAIDRPWEAWDVVARDMLFFKSRGVLKIEHAGGLTTVYEKMQRLIRQGKQPAPEENDKLRSLQNLLAWFYERALFEPEDDFNDYLRKYAFVGLWCAGQYGHERLVAELLKDGPFPDPAKPRNHGNRKDPEVEDWKWIRLSLPSYSMALGDALDLDDPPEKWRKDEAVKLTDAMLKAAEHARQFGSLSSAEFQLLSARVFRAFLTKDWADLEKALQETARRNWARLTSDVAETIGRGARFVTPQEFVAQYRVFARYIKARTAYYTVIYEALRAEGIEHALQATKVASECWPGDEDMKREAQYLQELAAKKRARLKDKPPAGAPARQ